MMGKRTVLVTGSTRGIGKAIAIKFAENGYNVVINCSNNEELLQRTKDEIAAYHTSCLAFMGDMGKYEAVREMFDRIGTAFGTLDVLINNAGISYVGLLSDMIPADWDRVISVNLTSVFNCCRLAVPGMVKRKSGKIINISSVWGYAGASCEVAYSASKGGMNAFTKALAKELAPSNIQVNAVACGAIDTGMNSFLDEVELTKLIHEIPADRLGKPREAAELVYTLACSNAYLTGQIIGLDGGWI